MYKFMKWFTIWLFVWMVFFSIVNKVKAGSLYWTAYSITQHAPNVESSCFNNGSYLSTCNNTSWAYVNSVPLSTGTTTSLNYNWNNGNITIGGTNIGSEKRMLVIMK